MYKRELTLRAVLRLLQKKMENSTE